MGHFARIKMTHFANLQYGELYFSDFEKIREAKNVHKKS